MSLLVILSCHLSIRLKWVHPCDGLCFCSLCRPTSLFCFFQHCHKILTPCLSFVQLEHTLNHSDFLLKACTVTIIHLLTATKLLNLTLLCMSPPMSTNTSNDAHFFCVFKAILKGLIQFSFNNLGICFCRFWAALILNNIVTDDITWKWNSFIFWDQIH